MRTKTRVGTLALAALLAGCAGRGQRTPDKTLVDDKGTLPNGPQLNGTDVGGRVLGQVSLGRGVTLAGGQHLGDVRLEGTLLHSDSAGGADFVGAELQGATTDGTSVRLRIDGITAASDEIHLYRVSYQDRPGGPYAPLCPGGLPAIPLAGRWDHRHGVRGDGARRSSDKGELMLTCEGSAIAKCVRLGYRPWATLGAGGGPARVSLAPLHEACVRAVRADYCGNGDSLTRPGETINLYDTVGVQADTEQWEFEAEWTPEGARCVNETRLLHVPGTRETMLVRDYIQRHCPSRFRDGQRPCLGDPGATAFLFTEYPKTQR